MAARKVVLATPPDPMATLRARADLGERRRVRRRGLAHQPARCEVAESGLRPEVDGHGRARAPGAGPRWIRILPQGSIFFRTPTIGVVRSGPFVVDRHWQSPTRVAVPKHAGGYYYFPGIREPFRFY